jgi:hypothetical protein
MGLFQPQCREAKALLLAWLLASLRSSRPAYIAALPMSALGQKQTFDPRTAMSAKCHKRKLLQPWAPTHFPNLWLANEKSSGSPGWTVVPKEHDLSGVGRGLVCASANRAEMIRRQAPHPP